MGSGERVMPSGLLQEARRMIVAKSRKCFMLLDLLIVYLGLD